MNIITTNITTTLLDYILKNKKELLKNNLDSFQNNECYHKNPKHPSKLPRKLVLFAFKRREKERYDCTIISDCGNRGLDKGYCTIYPYEKYIPLSEKEIFYLQINL